MSISVSKNFQFRYPDNEKRPLITFTLQVAGWLPVIDIKTERFSAERIDDFTMVITPRKPDITEEDNNEDQDPNEEYKLE